MNKIIQLFVFAMFIILSVSCTNNAEVTNKQKTQDEQETKINIDEVGVNGSETTSASPEEIYEIAPYDAVQFEITQYSEEQVYIKLTEPLMENTVKYKIYLNGAMVNEYDWTFNPGISVDIDEFNTNSATLKMDIFDMDDNQLSTYELKNIMIIDSSDKKTLGDTDIYKQAETIVILGKGDIRNIDLCFLNDIKGLSSLYVVPKRGESILQIDFSQIESIDGLTYMSIDCTSIIGMQELNSLDNLVYLDLNETIVETEAFSLYFPNLVSLTTSDLSRFDYLPKLKEMTLVNNIETTMLGEYSEQLEALYIVHCDDIQNTDFITDFCKLKKLKLQSNSLTDISGIVALANLESLTIECDRLEMLPNLETLESLCSLTLYAYPINNLENLSTLKNLEVLNIDGGANIWPAKEIYDLLFLKDLNEIEVLQVQNMPNLVDISAIGDFTELEQLGFYYCYSIEDISMFRNLNKLKNLCLWGCAVSNISPLIDLDDLEYLSLSEDFVTDFNSLGEIFSLKYLDLYNPVAIDDDINLDINPLGYLDNLVWLSIRNENTLYDISSVRELKDLEYLNITGCNNIEDISFLSDIEGLFVAY